MPQPRAGESGTTSIHQMENSARNFVEMVCSVVAMPVEMPLLRPWHGTRYFSSATACGAALLMTGIPLLSALMTGLQNMIPFSHPAASVGLFDIGSLAKLFFISYVIHQVRLRRRMIHMHLETNSYFEGSPLPFFQWVPWCQSFWKIRLIAEPVFILLLSVVLQDFLIIQTSLAYYLRFAALALAMKNYIAWQRNWTYLRDLMDAQGAMPTLTKLVENQVNDDELSVYHLASFPKDIPEHIRAEAAIRIVRDYTDNH